MKLLLLTLATIFIEVGAEISITLCDTPSKGSPCNITCSTTGITGPVEFYKDGSLRATCHKNDGTISDSYNCIVPDAIRNDTTLTIRSLSRSRDDGFWTCTVDGKRSERKQLQIFDLSKTSVTSSVSQYGNRRKITLREGATSSLDIHLGCVYPKPEVSVVTDDPLCSVCDKKPIASASGSTKCDVTADEYNYNAGCALSWDVLVMQDACKCQLRKLYAKVHLFNTSKTVDLQRELDVLDKTECGKLTGFTGIELVPLMAFFVATVVLVVILCKTSYHYIEIQSATDYEFMQQ